MRDTHRGFTLLELIVVIAIIGILAGVLFAYLGDAKDKGVDAGVQRNLINARSQAENYYYLNGDSYTNLCTATMTDDPQGVADFVAQADQENGSGAATCLDSASEWAIEAQLLYDNTQYLCVDSTGNAETYTGSTISVVGSDLTCGP